ncbi:unnamed protein product [Leptidea sinapis]|uniref:Reverse transcriptase domain-containing protein n=1 Tax=Leptidea sinapis TaxID=189913 RepID=A0A5E4QU40_9NEOP|nr:unnamed protein product [Leptidea sinapis]
MKNSNKSNTLINLMLKYNFLQHINQPNRVTKTSSTCLDLIFTNFKDEHQIYVHDYGFSDHKGTIYQKKGLKYNETNKIIIRKRIYNENNINLFKSELDYKKYNKLLKQAVILSKKIDKFRRMARSNNITKSMWQIVRDSTNKNKIKPRSNITLNIHNKLTSKPQQIANAFNTYFASVGGAACAGHSTDQSTAGCPVYNPVENSMFLRLVEPREIYDIIRSLKNKNSCGIDEVPPSFLRKCAKELTLPLYLLINQSFTDGVFPDLLKKCIIRPVYRKKEEKRTQEIIVP